MTEKWAPEVEKVGSSFTILAFLSASTAAKFFTMSGKKLSQISEKLVAQLMKNLVDSLKISKIKVGM
ncbi:MAG: hypothetical protein ACXV8P_11130 [Methylobacter sp.]